MELTTMTATHDTTTTEATTNDADTIITPAVMDLLENAEKYVQAWHAKHGTSERTRPIEIFAAPDCDIDLLAEVPRVTLGPNGKHHLVMLPLEYEGDIGEEVEATASLLGSDLMLVRTSRGAFLMKKSDYEAHLPKYTYTEQDQKLGLAHWGGDGLYQCFNYALDDNALPPAARLLYDAGQELVSPRDVEYDAPDASTQRLAYVMMCDALLAAPDVAMAAIKRVRDDLVAGDPKLALMR
jgi:hypothetical protein